MGPAVRLAIAVLAVALTIATLTAPDASALRACGDAARAHDITSAAAAGANGPCNIARDLANAYYADPTCSQEPEDCSLQSDRLNWGCDTLNQGRRIDCTNDKGNEVAWFTARGYRAITALSLAPTAFRAKSHGGPIATSGGTKVTYTLTGGSARVFFTIYHRVRGHKTRGGCQVNIIQTQPSNCTT